MKGCVGCRLQRSQAWNRRVWLCCLVILTGWGGLRHAGWAQATAGPTTLLDSHDALYARLVSLGSATDPSQNDAILATVTSFTGGNHVDVYRSLDQGKSFAPFSSIKDPVFATGLCCGTLFELPRRVGALAAGTLLWAGSVGQKEPAVGGAERRMQIRVYASVDEGKTWSVRDGIVAKNKRGLWEPQFALAEDGALVMYYSDETHPAQSQLLEETRTYDGVHWQDFRDVVASAAYADRPGMPVVNLLRTGIFLMTYEVCGPLACVVNYRTSRDGWNWGDPTNLGRTISTPEGLHLAHAPVNTALPEGAILLTGQMELKADGSVAAGNGETMFWSRTGDPAGPWSTLPAPIAVPEAYDNYCPNYSSPLLALDDQGSVLEFASRRVGTRCLMFYATAPRPPNEIDLHQ